MATTCSESSSYAKPCTTTCTESSLDTVTTIETTGAFNIATNMETPAYPKSSSSTNTYAATTTTTYATKPTIT